MNKSVQDKIFAYVAACGSRGAGSDELAAQFLAPVSGPPALLEKLIRNILASDPRLACRPDGRWVVQQAATGPVTSFPYTVVEALEASAGGRSIILECGVCHVDSIGRASAVNGAAIRPDPWPAGLVVAPALKERMRQGTTLSEAVARASRYARGSTLVCWQAGVFQEAVAHALEESGTTCRVLSLKRLSRQLPNGKADSPEELAARLNIPSREPADAREMARFTAEMLSALLARGTELGLGEPDSWLEAQEPARIEVDYGRYGFDRAFIESLPERPGIYIMRDATGSAVYVGKARNLRERVKRYFRAHVRRDEKTERILEAVSRLEVQETGSELSALLAEQRTIRQLQPSINVQFDVHERPAAAPAKVAHRRLVLVLPAPGAEEAELFFIHADRAYLRMIVPRRSPEKVRAKMVEFFFGPHPPEPADEEGQAELQIIWSWLERNADRVNNFDVDLAGGPEPAFQLLERYLREMPSPGRVFHVSAILLGLGF